MSGELIERLDKMSDFYRYRPCVKGGVPSLEEMTDRECAALFELLDEAARRLQALQVPAGGEVEAVATEVANALNAALGMVNHVIRFAPGDDIPFATAKRILALLSVPAMPDGGLPELPSPTSVPSPVTEAEPSGWRLIESAPKTYSKVLLWSPMWEMTWGVVVGWWNGRAWETDEGVVGEDDMWEPFDDSEGEDDEACSLAPTHWMPLPPPPAESGASGRPLGAEDGIVRDEHPRTLEGEG